MTSPRHVTPPLRALPCQVPDFTLAEGYTRDGKEVEVRYTRGVKDCDAWLNSLVDALSRHGQDAAWLVPPDCDGCGDFVFGPALVAEARRTSEPAARFQLLLGAIAGRLRRAIDVS